MKLVLIKVNNEIVLRANINRILKVVLMFSAGNVKSQDVLKKAHLPTSNPQEEIWLTGEQDALHIPLLNAELQNGSPESHPPPCLLNPFGIYIEDTKQIRPEITQEAESSNNSLNESAIAVYTINKDSALGLQQMLAQHPDLSVQYFDASMSDEEFKTMAGNINRFSMWIINLSDDDESPLLDSVLECCADANTLFLSGALSTRCKHKINDFINEDRVH